jgi:hypothetical protein
MRRYNGGEARKADCPSSFEPWKDGFVTGA